MNAETKSGIVIDYLASLQTPVAIEIHSEETNIQAIVICGKLYCLGDLVARIDFSNPVQLGDPEKSLLVHLFSVCEEPLVQDYAHYFLQEFKVAIQAMPAVSNEKHIDYVHELECAILSLN